MKQNVFCRLIALICLISACKKDKAISDEDIFDKNVKHEITFKVGNFSSIIEEISATASSRTPAKATAIEDAVNYIYYMPHKHNNISDPNTFKFAVKFVTTDSSASNFGSIKDTLLEGRYDLIFFASREPLTFYREWVEAGDIVTLLGNSPGTDTYYKAITMDISGEVDRAIDVELERSVANLQIQIEDPLPFEVRKISIWAGYSEFQSALYNWKVTGSIDHEEYPQNNGSLNEEYNDSDAGKILSYNLYYPKYSSEFGDITEVHISAYDVNGQRLYSTTINDVPLVRNKRTVLKGKLFRRPDDSDGGFKISLPDTTWGNGGVINF